MEMMAVLLALVIPYIMVKVQPEGFVPQVVFALSLIINGLGIMITGVTLNYDLLFRPIFDPVLQSCQALCGWTLAEPAGIVAFTFMVIMCLGGIGMLYTAIIDKRYSPMTATGRN